MAAEEAESRIELVRELFERSNARELGRTIELFTEDVELVISPQIVLTAGTYHGLEGLANWFGDWYSQFSEVRFADLECHPVGDLVVGVSRQHAVGRSSGAATEMEIAWVYAFRDGRISYLELCQSPADADRRAAELG